MPKKGFNGKMGLRFDEATTANLKAMHADHGVEPVELARRLIEAACQFYRQHGWFSLPVVIEPKAFQERYVAEQQAAYEAGKKKKPRP